MHQMSAKLRNNTAPLKVAVVGVGGTGSEVLSALINVHLGLRALGKPGLEVHAFDPDTVSETNLVRQRYYPQDIGLPKAQVLIHRINLSVGAAMGVKWVGRAYRFDSECARYPWDIVLSCVDSRKERRKLHGYASQKRFTKWALWGDFGNDADCGQVLFGEPGRSRHALPWATQIHPDLIDLSLPDDDTPSCSTIEAIERQGLLINKTVATLGVQLLWEALKTGRMVHHGYYFNYTRGSFQGVPIPPECVNVKVPQERAETVKPSRAPSPRRKAPAGARAAVAARP